MLLFIFESIGTSELILIGIIALIFLGPRKLPEIARKIGRVMADLRNTTNEFKSTWEREVNFEAEEQALRTGELPDETIPVERVNSILPPADEKPVITPEIREIDAASFQTDNAATATRDVAVQPQLIETNEVSEQIDEKQNWL